MSKSHGLISLSLRVSYKSTVYWFHPYLANSDFSLNISSNKVAFMWISLNPAVPVCRFFYPHIHIYCRGELKTLPRAHLKLTEAFTISQRNSIQFNLNTCSVCHFPPMLNLYQLTEQKGWLAHKAGWFCRSWCCLFRSTLLKLKGKIGFVVVWNHHMSARTQRHVCLSAPSKMSTLLCPFCRPNLVWLSLWSRMAVAPSATFPASVILPLSLPS